MCESHWLEYNAGLATKAGVPLTVEAVLPLAIESAQRWAAGALGYGEGCGDDVRKHTATLFGTN